MKYIIFDDTFPVISDNMTGHNEIKYCSRFGNKEATSAGMFYFKIKNDSCGNELIIPVCYGKSTSLNLEAKEIDSYLIAKTMYDFVDREELKTLCKN